MGIAGGLIMKGYLRAAAILLLMATGACAVSPQHGRSAVDSGLAPMAVPW
jgi:hypothetical protein